MAQFSTAHKLVDREAATSWARELQSQGKKVVFTNGVFDLLHLGHVRYLEQARSLGDALIVGVNTDASVRRLGKGHGRPINTQDARSALVASLVCVDMVVLFDEDTPLKLISELHPDLLVKGGDYREDKVVGREVVKGWGGKVKVLSFVEGYSTASLLKKINLMQEYDYFFNLNIDLSERREYRGILCLDRDGVIIEEKNYLQNPAEVEFINGSLDALRDIIAANFFVAVISNQSGIAKGIITLKQFREVNRRFINLLEANNALVHCIVYCPYHPNGIVKAFSKDSIYRKPAPGMFELIKSYYDLKINNIYMVGDKNIDIEFGKNIGANCFIVDTGHGLNEKQVFLSKYNDVISVKNLLEAVKWILKKQKQ